MGWGCQRFQYCIPGSLSRQREEEVRYNPSLSHSGVRFCSAPAGWILFLNPVQTHHMEMGDRVCERVTEGREGKAWKHSSCLEWWGLCSAQAGDLVGSSRKQLLLCLKRKRAPQLPLGTQNSRENRGTIPWTVAHRPCLETAVCKREEICLQICWISEVGHDNLGGIRNTTKCRKGG